MEHSGHAKADTALLEACRSALGKALLWIPDNDLRRELIAFRARLNERLEVKP